MTDILPPPIAMMNLVTGYWLSKMIHVVAKLGIADLLTGGPRSVTELAAAAEVNADRLYRVLRTLASVGVFVEDEDGRFDLTPLAGTLRRDVPGFVHGFAVMVLEDSNWEAWRELGWAVNTGGVAFHKAVGMAPSEYLASHPEYGQVFGEAMTSLSASRNPAIVKAFDFSGIGRLVDVRGGHGSLTAMILNAHPEMQGVLFDVPPTIENTRRDRHVNAPAVAGRIESVGGDFFDTLPADADCYIMKYILHYFVQFSEVDWWLDEVEQFVTGRAPQARPAAKAGRTRVVTLGGFGVVREGQPIALAAWGSRRARMLCKRLAAAAGEPVPRDQLIELLWPDEDDPARLSARLSVQLSMVRRLLGGGVIADVDSVRLDLAEVDLDLVEFHRSIRDGRDEDAITLHRGEFLPEDLYADWTIGPRDRARNAVLGALHRVATCTTDAGTMSAHLQHALTLDPFEAGAHEQLIGVLHHAGRLGEATRAHAHYTTQLNELGVTARPLTEITTTIGWSERGRRIGRSPECCPIGSM